MERWLGCAALVTGASSGFGYSIAAELVRKGLKVVGVARRVERIQGLAEELSNEKGKLWPLKVDLAKEEEIVEAFRWTSENVGVVQILINNAGIFKYNPVLDCNLDKLRAMFNVNVIAPALCAREYFKWIKTVNSNGHIININSIAGVKTLPNKGLHSYSASKQAAKCISEGMRFEILQTKLPIKITDLYPGCGATELFGEEEMKELIGVIGDPTAFLKPQEIADAVVHVLSTDPEVRISNMMIQHSREIFM